MNRVHEGVERLLGVTLRLAQTLKPGGRIAIHDFVARQSASAEPVPRLFSLIMLVWTREGQAYSLPDYQQMLSAAGFGAPQVHDLPGMPTRFLIAERSD